MKYIQDETPLFILPKEASTSMSRRLDDVFDELFHKEIDDPPYKTFAVKNYFLDNINHRNFPPEAMKDPSFVNSELFLNSLRPYITKYVIAERVPKKLADKLVSDRPVPESNKTAIVYSAQIYVELDTGHVMFDMVTQKKWYSPSVSKPMTEAQKVSALELSEFSYVKLIALLSLKVATDKTVKKAEKTGTSAQRRRSPDKYFTEIEIKYSPDLERIVREKHETINSGSKGSKSPHMRRGFVKTQRYGPKFSMTREIFIDAVHVNKDKGPAAPRQKYLLKVEKDQVDKGQTAP